MHRFKEVIKSKNDKLCYRAVKIIENNLKCLLIQDKETKKSAASMNVAVGSLKDPKEFEGLAHFLEHMLFMGSEKYPEEKEYKKFVSDNGGKSNAYTSLSNTNYHFEVSNEGLNGALDRFAQFFISPLFSPDCVDREVNAVHSEFMKNLKLDSRRNYQIYRGMAHPDSLFNKFSTGNKDTLVKEGIRDQLIKFYHEHYSADRMNLVVYSNEDLDDLEHKILEIFKGVKDKNLGKISYKGEIFPFGDHYNGRFVKITPVKDKDEITIKFYLPPLDHLLKKKVLGYYSHLIGHESKGSLLDFLIKEKLALSLTAGSYLQDDYFSTLKISITLTEKGFKEYPKVIEALGAYINVLRENEIQEWVYEEKKKVAELKFEFMNKSDPYNMVKTLSDCMETYEPHEAVKNLYIYDEFDKEEIKKQLDYLKIENSDIFLVSKKLEDNCDLVEPIYSTPYNISKISEVLISKFNKPEIELWKTSKETELSYPPKNFLIPDSYEIHPMKSELTLIPKIIQIKENARLHYLQYNKFENPKVALWLKIYSNDQNSGYSAKTHALRGMFVSMFEEVYRDYSYLAEMASSSVAITNFENGLSLNIRCYDQRIGELLNSVNEAFLKTNSFEDVKKFQDIRTKKLKNLDNYLKKSPYKNKSYYIEKIFVDK